MKKLLIIFLLVSPFLQGQGRTDKKLQKKIEALIKDYHGQIGIYVKDLKKGRVVSINADTLFPTASIVKVPIFLGIIDRINKGELNYDTSFTYKDSLLYAGSDILGSFKNNETISLKKLIMLMLTTSDNTASLWLQSIAGTGTRINELLASLGLNQTRINSRTPGREGFRAIYQWGMTSPAEMGTIFEKIYRHEYFTPELCDRMLRCLGRNFWDEDEGISEIPPTIEVFSKNGCVDASRSEVMLVNGPHHPYVFCIFTKNNTDTSWKHSNEAWTMARKISKLLWEHYEPRY
jgi:beta-lactamase class A